MPDDASSEGIKQKSIEEGGERETIHAAPPPNYPSAPPAQPVSNKYMNGEVKTLEDRVKRAEWLMIGLTACIVLLTLGLVIVGILQWNAMRGQLIEMRSGSIDTAHLVEAAKKQAAANVQQVSNFAALAMAAKDQAEDTAKFAERMKEQAALMHEEVVGARGAILDIRLYLDQAGVELGIAPALGAAQFVGQRVAAKNINLDVTVTTKKIPDMTPIGSPLSLHEHIPLMSDHGYELYPIPFQDFPEAFDRTRRKLDRIIAVEGSWSYDNGFGETIKSDICRKFIGWETPGVSVVEGFRDCGAYPAILDEVLGMKAKYEATQKKPN